MKELELENVELSKSDFLKPRLGCNGDYFPLHKSWRRNSNSSKSLSSVSTICTSKLNSRDFKEFSHNNKYTKFRTNDKEKTSTKLEQIHSVISELYLEEIVPSVHEIRRKLNKNFGFFLDGQKLLKLCSADSRFSLMRLQSRSHNSRDVQKDWAVLLRDTPFTHFNKEIDEDLVKLVSDYLVFISSQRYKDLTNCKGNGSFENHNKPCILNELELEVEIVPFEDILNIGGRYVFAEHLKKNGPNALRDLSLGTLASIVQKLNELGFLTYRGNCLVPVANSRSAASKFVMNLTKNLDDNHLQEIIKKFTLLFQRNKEIALSSLPMVYKKRFGQELGYQEFGYQKLSDFIKSEIEECQILTQRGQIVVTMPSNKEQSTISEASTATNSPVRKPLKTSGNHENIPSQTLLNTSYTTVLYPLRKTNNESFN